MDKYNYILCELNDNIGKIVINRPEITNKIHIDCMNEIMEALTYLGNNSLCRIIILTGVGEYFCNGGELGDFRKQSQSDIEKFGRTFIKLHIAIKSINKLVIAMVQGHVLGGGISLLEACDLAVASNEALFGVPEMSVGLAPMMCLTGLSRITTGKKLMEMAMTGESICAKEALALNMINLIVDKEELEEKTMAYANKFLNNNPTSVSLTKKIYRDFDGFDYNGKIEKGLEILISLLTAKNSYEVLDAKEQNRSPVWKYE